MIAAISRVAVPLQRPGAGRQTPRRARAVTPRAMLPDMVATIGDAAAAAPGSVDAPIGAIVLGERRRCRHCPYPNSASFTPCSCQSRPELLSVFTSFVSYAYLRLQELLWSPACPLPSPLA